RDRDAIRKEQAVRRQEDRLLNHRSGVALDRPPEKSCREYAQVPRYGRPLRSEPIREQRRDTWDQQFAPNHSADPKRDAVAFAVPGSRPYSPISFSSGKKWRSY